MRDDLYFERMKRGFTEEEKLFFLKHVDITSYSVIVDFGSADGTMLKIIDQILCKRGYDDKWLIGIDNTFPLDVTQMINKTSYCRDISELLNEQDSRDCLTHGRLAYKAANEKVLVIFSSVLHEVSPKQLYGYNSISSLARIATTVVCRDMYFDPCLEEDTKLLQQIEGGAINLRNTVISDIQQKCLARFNNKQQCNQDGEPLCQINAPITCSWYEALLKSEYPENIERELQENYFSNNAKSLLNYLVGRYGRWVLYKRTYTLPCKKREFKKRYGIKLTYPTHIQWIVEG